MTKRAFDAFGALLGLLLLSSVLIAAALLIKLDSRGPVFFRQERIGKGFRPFVIYKFRTMVQDALRKGGPITVGEDSRITRVGRVLRKTKIDEIPQLINVLKGEISLVGPRPEVRKYVEMFKQDYAEILTVRPGMTDLASIKYRNEVTILGQVQNPEEEYIKQILPDKITLAKKYIQRHSLLFDVTIIFRTLLKLIGWKAAS